MNSLARSSVTTRFVFLAACFVALGGLLFGYDTGVISGAVIFIKKDFALSVFPQELVVSMLLVGAAIGALSEDVWRIVWAASLLLLTTSIIFIAGAIVCALAVSQNMLLAGRVVVGVGIGLASITVPLYISESLLRKREGGRCPSSNWVKCPLSAPNTPISRGFCVQKES